jgi:hypothetical protein
MFQQIQRRASRVGSKPQKVIVTIDLQTLELHSDEHTYPPDSLVSLTLERGSKFSSSSEKSIEWGQVNPLNKQRNSITKENVTSTSPTDKKIVSKVDWNERLEIVATLYKDTTSNTYQEKVCLLKMKIINDKEISLGFGNYQTIGKYALALHEIMNIVEASALSVQSIMGPVYEQEMKVVFQRFKNTSLQFNLRITTLMNSPNASAFNSFIYGKNSRSSFSMLSGPSGGVTSNDDDDDNKNKSNDDEGSISSDLYSHDSIDDICFEYTDLKETRPMINQASPWKAGTNTTTTSTPGSAMKKQSSNDDNNNIQISSQQNSASSIDFSNYGKKDAKSRSRSMIVVGSNHPLPAKKQQPLPLAPVRQNNIQAKSLSGLFPGANDEEQKSPMGEEEIEPVPRSPIVSKVRKGLNSLYYLLIYFSFV